MARDGRKMDRTIGRTPKSGIDDNGILKRLPSEDPRWPQIFLYHLDNPPPGTMAHLQPFPIRRGDRRTPGQRHAQRFGQTVHGKRRAHGVAVPHTRR